MALEDDFKAAADRVKGLSKTPDNDTLLKLYALYKQGSTGDVSGKRPGMLDLKGRAKFDAWKAVSGISKPDAMQKYVSLVDDLLARDK
jgi:acyl-CoA-binding protein